MGFALHYVAALATVALMLLGLHAVARSYTRRRLHPPQSGRIADVLESTPLTQQAALHVVGIEGRRYLVGSASNCIVLLASLPNDPHEGA
jgi:flagellar biogenesis protein FliO